MNPNPVGDGLWWLRLFLTTTFFEECCLHTNVANRQRNRHGRLNQFCIDCEMAACHHCMLEETHMNHRAITIYRLSRREVVDEEQMSDYIDCTEIQKYASNGKQVLAIHPLPHKDSGEQNPDRACWTCSRVLMNPDTYHYCSIACKQLIRPTAATTSKSSGSRKHRRKSTPERSLAF